MRSTAGEGDNALDQLTPVSCDGCRMMCQVRLWRRGHDDLPRATGPAACENPKNIATGNKGESRSQWVVMSATLTMIGSPMTTQPDHDLCFFNI
jgi:hypothetical protein